VPVAAAVTGRHDDDERRHYTEAKKKDFPAQRHETAKAT
jgi:hypothetical protein